MPRNPGPGDPASNGDRAPAGQIASDPEHVLATKQPVFEVSNQGHTEPVQAGQLREQTSTSLPTPDRSERRNHSAECGRWLKALMIS